MESLQTTKTRLKAVKNVGQITKAMEVVAATKMRRAQEAALNTRPYAYEALKLLGRVLAAYLPAQAGLRRQVAPLSLPMTVARPVKKTLVLIVASDRGLAGSFNGQIFKLADQFFTRDELAGREGHEYLIVSVGKKAAAYSAKKPFKTVRTFDNAMDVTELGQIAELSEFLTDGFLKKDWDRVVTISTHFRTALKQEPLLRQILPLDLAKIKETIKEIVPERGRYSGEKVEMNGKEETRATDYILEPSPRELLENLMAHLAGMQIYHLFLEVKASEHSARRVAMKTASDNATELGDALTLEYNKARQVGITRELAEITTTIMTLE